MAYVNSKSGLLHPLWLTPCPLVRLQIALHTMRVPFHICTDDIQYSGQDVIASMLPVIGADANALELPTVLAPLPIPTTDLQPRSLAIADYLLDAGLRIMIYSGDVDGIVPTTGTRIWVEGLGLPVKKAWTPWLSPGPENLKATAQVGGYVTEFDGLMFATVRGAGHMVPFVQPERSILLFNAFLRWARRPFPSPGLASSLRASDLCCRFPHPQQQVPCGLFDASGCGRCERAGGRGEEGGRARRCCGRSARGVCRARAPLVIVAGRRLASRTRLPLLLTGNKKCWCCKPSCC